jgi:hypothetical protein
MNALGTPPAVAGPADGSAGDRRDWLKLTGGMMFAAGVLVLLARKGQDWSKGAVFVALLVGAGVLLGLAFARASREALGGWRSAYAVFGTLLLLGALIELVNVLGGNLRAELNITWTFAVAGAVAVFTSFALRAPFQMLLGALFGVVVWLTLWDKLLSHPSGDTVRWLLLVLAAIYFGVAVTLSRARRPQASDLVTVAGLAAVLAASLSFAAAAGALSGSFSAPLGSQVPRPSQGWNAFLLVISLVLIWWAARGPVRGPGYVGALGLTAFILLTGADLVHRLSPSGGGGGVAGWPLILLIGGGIVLAAGFVLKPGALGGPGGAAGGPGGGGARGGPGGFGGPGGAWGGPIASPAQVGPPAPPGGAPPPDQAPPHGQPPPTTPEQPTQGQPTAPERPTQVQPTPAQPGQPAPDQPTATRPIPPEPGGAPPPPQKEGQPGGLLDQWRQEPPPGSGPPPRQS